MSGGLFYDTGMCFDSYPNKAITNSVISTVYSVEGATLWYMNT